MTRGAGSAVDRLPWAKAGSSPAPVFITNFKIHGEKNVTEKNISRAERVVEALLKEIALTSQQDFFGEITLILKISQGTIQIANIYRETRVRLEMPTVFNNGKDKK